MRKISIPITIGQSEMLKTIAKLKGTSQIKVAAYFLNEGVKAVRIQNDAADKVKLSSIKKI